MHNLLSRLFVCLLFVPGCSCERGARSASPSESRTEPPGENTGAASAIGSEGPEPNQAEAFVPPAAGSQTHQFTLSVASELRYDEGGEAQVQGLAFAPDGLGLVATGWGGKVVLFDFRNGQGRELHQLGGGDLFQARAVAWKGAHVAVGTFYKTLIFNSAGALVHEDDARANHVAFSEDGSVLYRATPDGVDALDPASGQQRAHATVANPHGLAVVGEHVVVLAPDEAGDFFFVFLNQADLTEVSRTPAQARTLAGSGAHMAASFLGEATLYDAQAGSPTTLANGAVTEPTDFVFGGEQVVARGTQSLGLYDLASGALLAHVNTPTTEGLAFDTNGRRIFVGTPTGVMLVMLQAEATEN